MKNLKIYCFTLLLLLMIIIGCINSKINYIQTMNLIDFLIEVFKKYVLTFTNVFTVVYILESYNSIKNGNKISDVRHNRSTLTRFVIIVIALFLMYYSSYSIFMFIKDLVGNTTFNPFLTRFSFGSLFFIFGCVFGPISFYSTTPIEYTDEQKRVKIKCEICGEDLVKVNSGNYLTCPKDNQHVKITL